MTKSDWLSNSLMGVAVSCALGMTALSLRREFRSEPMAVAAAPTPPPKIVADWKDYAVQGHSRGQKSAPVTIVEFSDFQCPYCRALASNLDSIVTQFPRDVRVVYRHFPIERLHAHAYDLAMGSECAAEQGRFFAFHDVVFARQKAVDSVPLSRIAQLASIKNNARFLECVASGRFGHVIEADRAAARKLHARGTPTVLINQRLYFGVLSTPTLRAAVQDALKKN